ncbi:MULTISPECIES: hypothetical protein [unclassified Mesorhizobium]|uniref:hypothetical protein n=1 Tax=unclassified Mesorhizobium TaxID=325217 RepID=UPI0011266837|nr:MULTISPECIES: hypothetical protein [unclassified Mesorhizobium]MBZ9894516.1 hypothetical protein [Mesorhizobium sp. BR1-1-6]TPN38437.1 hypothetical protein FJ979_13900 [Mesorhizobium sp. B1-1-6]
MAQKSFKVDGESVTFTAKDAAELNRLIGRGLNNLTAMAVMEGKLDEGFEVTQAEIERKAQKWGKGRKNIPKALVPGWDCDPARIYLAYDGNDPDDRPASNFALIEADMADIHPKLTYQATRDKDPWHVQYKSKSIEIGYRWVHGLRVSPPVIAEHEGEIVIVGGMHRYHLRIITGPNGCRSTYRSQSWPRSSSCSPMRHCAWRSDTPSGPLIGPV